MIGLVEVKTPLEKLQEIIRDLPRDDSPETVKENLALISSIGRPDFIIPLLRQVLAAPDQLALIAGRSYRHVNHFDKIALVESEDQTGYRLTLHLWSPPYTEKELSDELIHDHRFNFWSTILVGTLVSENFEKSDQGASFQQYQYIPEEHSSSNFYTFKGKSLLAKSTPSAALAGQSYHLRYERIHRVLLPRESMVCTVVLRGPRQRIFSNIYNTTYPSNDVQMVYPFFTGEQLKQRLTSLIDAVTRNLDCTIH